MKIIFFSLLCILSLNVFATNHQDWYDKGKAYDDSKWNAKNFEQLVFWYTKAAEAGHIQANINLALFYNYKKPDKKKKAYWYTKAAELGDAESQYELGGFYYDGAGVPKNIEKSLYWYTRAAQQNYVGAQSMLGNMYSHTYSHWKSVPLDYKKSIYWLTEAANNNVVNSQIVLAEMYLKGTGTQINNRKAAKLYQKAAKLGHTHSQYKLGLMYQNGQGVIPSNIDAYAWFALAALNGDKKGLKSRDIIAKQLTNSGLEKAQRMAAELSEKIK